MAFDFPSSPILDQTYTSGDVTFVWNGYAWVTTAQAADVEPADFVLKTGDTMSGPLTLNDDPVDPLHAAPKQYVDAMALPLGGTQGQALVADASGVAVWGGPVDGGGF